MRSDFFKNLSSDERYSVEHGLAIHLYEKYLKEFGLDSSSISIEKSQIIGEIVGNCLDQMHEEIKERLSEELKEQ